MKRAPRQKIPCNAIDLRTPIARMLSLRKILVNGTERAGDSAAQLLTRLEYGSGSGSGMFYIRLRPSTAIGCGTKQ
jgi:hypothetical protein